MAKLARHAGRIRKMEVAYIFLCLFFESIADVPSAIKANVKNSQTPSVKNMIDVSNDKVLNRKSRGLPRFENPAVFGDRKNVFESDKELPQDFKSAPILPYMIPGRSEGLLNVGIERGSAFENKRTKESSLIPFPRLGRKKAFDANSIMPYPDSWITPYLYKTQGESSELSTKNDTYFEGMPMNGDYTSNSIKDSYENYDVESIAEEEDNQFLEREISAPLPSHSDYKLNKSIKKRQVDDNGTIIPYPRLGRQNEDAMKSRSYEINSHLIRKKRNSDFLIPQIRYGRSTLTQKLPNLKKESVFILPNYRPGRSATGSIKLFKNDKVSKQGILPYPRPGRSEVSTDKRQGYILPLPRLGRSADEDKIFGKTELLMQLHSDIPELNQEDLIKSGESPLFVIPYPRPGKRFFGTKPLPPNVKFETKEKEQSTSQEIKDKEPTLTTFVLPYPRPGRSNNEKNENNYLIPYARFGRSNPNSMVPYPRPGRSNITDRQFYMLPYPRAGRSNKSEFILPYPRLGRYNSYDESNNILSHNRLGRSSTSSLLPYPRMGRSIIKISPQSKQSKSSNSIFVLPYPRLGRGSSSGSIIPQLRVGKSHNAQTFLTMEEPESHNYEHIEQQEEEKYPSNHMVKADENTLNEIEDTIYNSISHNFINDKYKSAALVPAKKLHKHMLTGESDYMLPYPRPGRLV